MTESEVKTAAPKETAKKRTRKKPRGGGGGKPAKPLTREGAYLRIIRNGRGLSQGELAKASGVDQSTISAMERGDRSPNLKDLNLILAATDLTLVGFAELLEKEVCPTCGKKLP